MSTIINNFSKNPNELYNRNIPFFDETKQILDTWFRDKSFLVITLIEYTIKLALLGMFFIVKPRLDDETCFVGNRTTRPKDNSPRDNSPHIQKTTRPTSY